MDPQVEIRKFLMQKRASLTPETVGLRRDTGRKVPGLRREEVARLAGVSLEYYTRIERGKLTGVSAQVLGAIAGALHLTDDERLYLFDLASPSRAGAWGGPDLLRLQPANSYEKVQVSDFMVQLIRSIQAPAMIQNHRLEIVEANDWARELFSPQFAMQRRPVSTAHFIFLSPEAPKFYEDYEAACDLAVGALRSAMGKDPLEEELSKMIEELSTLSPDFSSRWAEFSVHQSTGGRKVINHPTAGRLDLSYDDLLIPDQPQLMLLTYMATPQTDSQEKLAALKPAP